MRNIICLIIILSLSGCATTPRKWTAGEKVTLGWSVLASIADGYTTTRFLNNPDNYEMCPYIGKHPSNEKVIVFLSLSQLIATGLAHWYPDLELPFIGKVNMQYGLLGTKAVLNTGCAINNTQLDWD